MFLRLQYFGSEGDDLHILIAKLTSDGTENTSTAHFTLVVQKHHGVIVETDVRSVGTSDLLGRSNYDCLRYSTLLDIARKMCIRDRTWPTSCLSMLFSVTIGLPFFSVTAVAVTSGGSIRYVSCE